MTDPLSLFPIALAAGGGRLDGVECRQLVAAGLTVLQRSAGLVRALSGRRSGILVPVGPAFFCGLAASDGRGAVLLDAAMSPADIAWQIADANVGAVFTTTDLAGRLPVGVPLVLLDDAPRSADVRIDGQSRRVDLGSHVGLQLEGSRDAEGLDEECVLIYEGRSRPVVRSHRELIGEARSGVARTDEGILGALTSTATALIAGADVSSG